MVWRDVLPFRLLRESTVSALYVFLGSQPAKASHAPALPNRFTTSRPASATRMSLYQFPTPGMVRNRVIISSPVTVRPSGEVNVRFCKRSSPGWLSSSDDSPSSDHVGAQRGDRTGPRCRFTRDTPVSWHHMYPLFSWHCLPGRDE